MIFIQFYFYLPRHATHLLPVLRWFLVTLLFILFLFAYIFRKPAKSLARSPKEILLPAICAGLPFLVMLAPRFIHDIELLKFLKTPLKPLLIENLLPDSYDISGLTIMAIGEAITVLGMMYLRSSFSIFTEVRDFVRTGIYQFIRHPLYLGEILSLWGFAILAPSLWVWGGTVLFTVIQSYRATREEKKILGVYPEYADYKKKAGFLWPRF